jgi:tetratricopeptide (TPR) repeat protein
MMTAEIGEPATIPPWRRACELDWQPRQAGLVLCGAGHDGAHCLEAAGGYEAAAAPPTRITVAAPRAGFDNMAGFDALLAVLLPVVRETAPHLLTEHARTLDLIVAPEKQGFRRLVPISEAAALGTTRRISRESHAAALWLDAAARFLAAAAAALSGPGTPGLVLDIEAIDLWDRPSLRILHRAVVHGDSQEGPLWCVGRLRHYQPAPLADGALASVDGEAAVACLRSAFLAGLTARRVVSLHDGVEPASWPAYDVRPAVAAARVHGQAELLKLIGDALALQNFERVELLIAAARPDSDDETRGHLLRLSAISRAQVGEIDAASARLEESLAVATRAEDAAHLCYLRGLIATKRRYNLDAAVAAYQEAQDLLVKQESLTADGLVESAWAHNGLALAEVIRARESATEAEREACYARAFEHEFTAFRMVRDVPGPSAFYLRYNLGYNLSFLLEITGRYQEAQAFLTSVSAVLLQASRPDFGALYKYTIGLLQGKAGDGDAAAKTLAEAVSLADSLRDPFYIERLYAALAYVENHQGAHERAASHFREGASIARWLRDEDAYRQHLAGLLWSIALGRLPYPADVASAARTWYPEVADVFAATDDPDRRCQALTAADAVISVPSAKLPSYIPSVDLEGTPGRDLNRYLTGATATEKLGSQAARPNRSRS